MRLISIDQVTGNEVLAQSLYDIDGRKLLNAGVSLRPAILQKLYDKGVTNIYIEDELSEGIEIHGALCEETRSRAKLIIRDEMNRLSQKKEINYTNLNGTVDSILDEILSRRIDIVNVKDIRMQDEQTFAHSVNVCVMAIALATKLSLPVSKIKSIAMGALMHDIGKAFLPSAIMNKTDQLTDKEMNEYKKHPILGYNMIKDDNDASATTKISVLMHHEHFNGSGYPMGLAGDKIHYSARIITICDEFDSAMNDKNNKYFLKTTDAVEYMIGASGFIFDKSMVDEFIRMVPIYNEGSIVLLSNGNLAIVIKNNSINLTRPVVRAFYNPKTKTKLSKSNIIDLKEELSIKILREIKYNVNDLMP